MHSAFLTGSVDPANLRAGLQGAVRASRRRQDPGRLLAISPLALLAACGGGGGGTAPIPTPPLGSAPTPSPTPGATPTPTPGAGPTPTPAPAPAPTLADDKIVVAADGTGSVNVLQNDTGASLSIAELSSSAMRLDISAPFTVGGRFGVLTVAADGSASYVLGAVDTAIPAQTAPLGASQSATEFFTYRVRGENAATSTATIAVEITRAAPATITGTGAADTLIASVRGARVEGGDGDDRLSGSYGSDVLVGGAGNDRLSGLIDERIATGQLAGADMFIGGAGDDAIVAGGAGTDIAVFAGPRSGYSITSSGGTTTVRDLDPSNGDDGVDTLTGIEVLQFTNELVALGGFGFPNVFSEDVLPGTAIQPGVAFVVAPPPPQSSAFVFSMDVALLLADGSPAPAWLSFDKATGRLSGTAPAGTDGLIELALRVTSNFPNTTLFETVSLYVYAPAAGDRSATAGAAETFAGTAGIDRVFGAGAGDVVIASPGADVYAGNLADTSFNVAAPVIDYSGSNAAIYVDLALGFARGGFAEGDIILGIGSLIGSAFDDILVTGSLTERVVPGAGNDYVRIDDIYASTRVMGGPGADVIDGGLVPSGKIDYSASPAAIQVNLVTQDNRGGDAEGDRILNVYEVVGSAFGDTIRLGPISPYNFAAGASGGDGDDHIVGGTGANDLNGGAGNDRLEGHEGDDLFSGGLGADVINGGDGIDTVDYDKDRSMPGGITVDLRAGTATGGDTLISIENVIGTFSNDVITGTDGANRILTLSGNDLVSALGGDDYVRIFASSFAAGSFDGGDGVDTLSTDGYTLIDLSTGQASGPTANATVANFENVELGATGTIIGNDADNRLSQTQQTDSTLDGRGGNDELRGSFGNDRLIGGAGADRLVGTDITYPGAPADRDTADYSGSAAAVRVDLRNGRAAGGDAEGDTLLRIEGVDGSAHGDLLVGSSALALGILKGLGGDDILVAVAGGTNAVTLTGGAGADGFVLAVAQSPNLLVSVTDFQQGSDKIDLSDLRDSMVAPLDIADILANATVQGGSTVISLDPFAGERGLDVSGTLTLQGFTGTLTAADFIFAGGADWESMAPAGPAVV